MAFDAVGPRVLANATGFAAVIRDRHHLACRPDHSCHRTQSRHQCLVDNHLPLLGRQRTDIRLARRQLEIGRFLAQHQDLLVIPAHRHFLVGEVLRLQQRNGATLTL
ncbi:hypothetical protein G6F57_021950 [Rhizopus arrhizus]|nr:hypothetical protein G6F57_021950 [Rhizopus arrhizus]